MANSACSYADDAAANQLQTAEEPVDSEPQPSYTEADTHDPVQSDYSNQAGGDYHVDSNGDAGGNGIEAFHGGYNDAQHGNQDEEDTPIGIKEDG